MCNYITKTILYLLKINQMIATKKSALLYDLNIKLAKFRSHRVKTVAEVEAVSSKPSFFKKMFTF